MEKEENIIKIEELTMAHRKLLRFLKKGQYNVSELANLTSFSQQTIRARMAEMKRLGYAIEILKSDGENSKYYIPSKPMEKSLKEIEHSGSSHYRIALLSDTHIGAETEDLESLHKFYQIAKEKGVREFFHSGDITDGTGVYPGQISELKVFTGMKQVEYAVHNYPEIQGCKTYFICLTPDTRVYIRNKGFVNYIDVKEGEEVLGVYRRGKERKFRTKWHKIKKNITLDYKGKIYETTSPILKMAVTPDHFVLMTASKNYKKLRYEPAIKVFNRSCMAVPMAGEIEQKDTNLSNDEIKLLAWFVAEGSWLQNKNGIQIYQNEDGIKQITDLLDKLEYKYSIYRGNGKFAKVIYISKTHKRLFLEWNNPKNKLDISRLISECSVRQLKIFINEYILGDGNIQSPNSFVIYTKSKQLAEQLSMVGILVGWRNKIHRRVRHIWNKDFEAYELYFYKNDLAEIPKRMFSQFYYDGQVFDLETEMGNFLVERKGTFFFTGNCGNHDLKLMQREDIDVGPMIAAQRSDMVYLGQYEANVFFEKASLRLIHPDGGMPYAMSYRLQKYVENIAGGTKPNIISMGHLHQSLYAEIRNIHCFLAGSFQKQNNFLRRKGVDPQISAWIIDFKLLNKNIDGHKITEVNNMKTQKIRFY